MPTDCLVIYLKKKKRKKKKLGNDELNVAGCNKAPNF